MLTRPWPPRMTPDDAHAVALVELTEGLAGEHVGNDPLDEVHVCPYRRSTRPSRRRARSSA